MGMGNNVMVKIERTPVEFVPVVQLSRFEDLYRHEYPGLVAVASLLTGDPRDGEDAVQDTMLKAFVHWKRVRGLEQPGAWCHRVLVNGCRSRWRRRQTERRGQAFLRSRVVTVPEPSADVIAFWSLVRTLPSRPRMVVTLHFAGERTMAEIAAILGVAEGTVHSDIARARVVIMEALGD
jgi:RNA polymerase sigma-70 factor (ECF subfamily)